MSNTEKKINALIQLALANTEEERTICMAQLKDVAHAAPSARKSKESVISDLLKEIGVPSHLIGYPYTTDAIAMILQDKTYLRKITKRLYPDIAAKFGTTESRVERAIRHAIEVAWDRVDWEITEQLFGSTVDPDKGKPTNAEFLARMADIAKERIEDV